MIHTPFCEQPPWRASSSPDLFPVRERINDSDSDPPALPPRAPLLRQPSPSLSPGVQWADLAAIQSQLQIQSQVRDCLFNQARCARSNSWCIYEKYYGVDRFDRTPNFFSRRLSLSLRNSMTWKGRGSLNNVTSRHYKVTYCTMTTHDSLHWVVLSPHKYSNTGLLSLSTRRKEFLSDSTLLNVATPKLS